MILRTPTLEIRLQPEIWAHRLHPFVRPPEAGITIKTQAKSVQVTSRIVLRPKYVFLLYGERLEAAWRHSENSILNKNKHFDFKNHCFYKEILKDS